MNRVRVLVVDDDEEDFLIARDLLGDISGDTEYAAAWASSSGDALARMVPPHGNPPDHDVCLLDFRLGAASGLNVLREARSHGYTRPVILMTGADSRTIDERALDAGASDYLVKGRIDASLLERTIRYAIAQKTTEEAIRTSARALGEARKREAEVGGAIQRMLLLREPPPQLPTGIAVGMHLVGAERITGDYCDFLIFRDRCFDVVIGDIMGKGIAAALVAAAVKSQLQRVARQLTADLNPFERLPEPQEIVGALDAAMTSELSALESFVTLAYVRFDLERRQLVLVDAGHPSLLYLPADGGEARFLHGENVPLGIAPGEFYVQKSLDLHPGDRFVLYSDGLTEAANADGEQFGPDRLVALARESLHDDPDPQTLVERLCRVADRWRDGWGDDLTCLAIQILPTLGAPEQKPQLRRCLEVESRPERLDAIRDFADRFCVDAGLAEDVADPVVLGLSEAAGNIIEHAYQGRADQRVRLEATLYTDRLVLRLHDRGRAFDPEAIPEPTLDGTMERGYGWFLMRQCFDEVRYRRDELGYNHLRLTRRLDRD